MMQLNLSNAPCSWGIEFADAPGNPPWHQVLDEIRDAGYAATELGPYGYLPTDVGQLREVLQERRLSLLAGTLFKHLHDPTKRADILADTRKSCELLQALDARYMVVIDHVCSPRTDQAGQVERATRLNTDDWQQMMTTIREAARICLDHGILPTLHPHSGTYIEYRDEVDKAMNDLAPEEVYLCIDTGHCQYAGMNPAEVISHYAERVKYLHFKDIDAEVHQQAVTNHTDFYAAVSAGIFTPLGKGCVDFSAVKKTLEAIDFKGWVTVEQDTDPAMDTNPLWSAQQSREFIQQHFLATA